MDMKQIVQNKRLRRCAVACALLAAALLACGPFLSGGVWHGSDLGYHLRRIENIAMGLADGRFPVRIQSDWLLGNGYAVGVFYGDILLYFPAALRLLGVPVTAAYDLYLFAVTLFTAAAAYYAVRRLAWPRMSALAAAVLYTLSAYRLCDVTDRAALGEYTALAFLPLAAAGLWRTLCPDSSRLPGWLLLVLGLSGVLQSHLLSFELTVLCLALAALVLARRTLARAALVRLAGAVGAFCALNAGFLVPLLDYYFTGKFQINQPGGVEPIQQNGAALCQLLGVGYALDAGQQQDLVKGMALTPGPALLLGALCAAGLAVRALLRRRPAGAAACLGLGAAGALGLALSSNLFPWDALYALGGAAERLIGSLQFPWRFLGPACLLLALAAAGGLALLRPRARAALAAVLCLLAAGSAAAQLQAYTAAAAPESYVRGTEEPFWPMSCGHYLPAENGPTDINRLQTEAVWADGIEMRDFQKQGLTVQVTAANVSDVDAWVQLPLLWYRGYTARDTATGAALPVFCGENNAVGVWLAPGYSGSFTVDFREPWHWRAAELLSLAVCAALGLCGARRCLRKRMDQKNG